MVSREVWWWLKMKAPWQYMRSVSSRIGTSQASCVICPSCHDLILIEALYYASVSLFPWWTGWADQCVSLLPSTVICALKLLQATSAHELGMSRLEYTALWIDLKQTPWARC
eukprot:1144560-Pelagomonas_calceolata.AAC.5